MSRDDEEAVRKAHLIVMDCNVHHLEIVCVCQCQRSSDGFSEMIITALFYENTNNDIINFLPTGLAL